MEQIYQLLQSYYNFQTSILRSMAFETMTKAEFGRVTGLYGNSKDRRHRNPKLWSPSEIYAFSLRLGVWDGVSKRLQSLAVLINCLPEEEKKPVLKASLLTEEKLQIRIQQYESWLPQELEKLYTFYHQNSITHASVPGQGHPAKKGSTGYKPIGSY